MMTVMVGSRRCDDVGLTHLQRGPLTNLEKLSVRDCGWRWWRILEAGAARRDKMERDIINPPKHGSGCPRPLSPREPSSILQFMIVRNSVSLPCPTGNFPRGNRADLRHPANG